MLSTIEPSNKKSKLESPGTEDSSQDDLEADLDPERNDDQEMETEQGSSQSTSQPKPCQGLCFASYWCGQLTKYLRSKTSQ